MDWSWNNYLRQVCLPCSQSELRTRPLCGGSPVRWTRTLSCTGRGGAAPFKYSLPFNGTWRTLVIVCVCVITWFCRQWPWRNRSSDLRYEQCTWPLSRTSTSANLERFVVTTGRSNIPIPHLFLISLKNKFKNKNVWKPVRRIQQQQQQHGDKTWNGAKGRCLLFFSLTSDVVSSALLVSI